MLWDQSLHPERNQEEVKHLTTYTTPLGFVTHVGKKASDYCQCYYYCINGKAVSNFASIRRFEVCRTTAKMFR